MSACPDCLACRAHIHYTPDADRPVRAWDDAVRHYPADPREQVAADKGIERIKDALRREVR